MRRASLKWCLVVSCVVSARRRSWFLSKFGAPFAHRSFVPRLVHRHLTTVSCSDTRHRDGRAVVSGEQFQYPTRSASLSLRCHLDPLRAFDQISCYPICHVLAASQRRCNGVCRHRTRLALANLFFNPSASTLLYVSQLLGVSRSRRGLSLELHRVRNLKSLRIARETDRAPPRRDR